MSTTLNDITADAQIVKQETVEEQNSATRIGQLFLDVISFIEENPEGSGSRITSEEYSQTNYPEI